MSELRDLDADRAIVDTLYKVEPHQWTAREKSVLLDIAAAALDEIEPLVERCKRAEAEIERLRKYEPIPKPNRSDLDLWRHR